MDLPPAYATNRGFLAPLEGLRAVAALGIVLTHTAFQTGMPANSIFARFDFFVPVFFALSAFLLWRRHRFEFDGHGEALRRYATSRVVRILPAYLVLVIGVFLLLPEAFGATATQVVANLTLSQIYVPNALAPGLTHLWSLCVEVAFYVCLPLVAWACMRTGGAEQKPARRLGFIATLAVASLAWPFLPFVVASPAPGVPNLQIFPVSYACWFAVGLVAAEFEGKIRWSVPAWLRLVSWLLALVVAWIAAQAWFGPLGLIHPSPWEFVRRVLAGTLFAALVLVPYAWDTQQSRALSSPVMQALGRWSYGIFLWHLPVLTWMFPLLGRSPFSGGFWLISLLTVLATIPIAAASYEFVERPAAQWLKAKRRQRAH
ncbi:putative acyltransferase [Corynebacterium epidermidicanis]|uniref:Putative acyltransferase n=1 Tax=Corynebacterium epidermidicanis TaxID=1050174 RepID=A0A0G3GUE3_9CORY|nr:putative acyltransferase [Corynebacterium epidermidicanis]